MTAFQKKKSLGQNFLTSPVVPGWMCDAAAVQPGDRILEIGPGTGALTSELLARGAVVTALEADPRAITILEETFSSAIAAGTLKLHHADARTLDIAKYFNVDERFTVVANIPYYLTGYLFRTLLESDQQPAQIVFLIQKEVAERIARAEKESLLSLSIKVFGEPRYVKTVSKGHFSPPPKIDSAIISVENISKQKLKNTSSDFFFTILQLGFGQKRKQLLGNLRAQFDRETLIHIFSTCSLDLSTRAEDIDLETWLTLVESLAIHIPTLSSE